MKKVLLILLIPVFALSCGTSNSDDTNKNDTPQNSAETPPTSLNPTKAVEKFIHELGKQNFQQAYNLTRNPKWGTFSDFSSKKSFGGISGTKILEIKLLENKPETAIVFANVEYTDKINGSNQFQQNFYLQKDDVEWRITDMRLTKKKETEPTENEQTILGVYTNETVYLIVYAFDTGKDFKGVLLDRANQFAVTGVYGVKTKKGYMLETVNNMTDENSQRCDIDLTFDKDNVTLNNPENCFNLNATLPKTKEFTTPKAGKYGDLEIINVADYSFTFKISINEGSHSCTGEIGIEEYATAYGINGVYVFDDYDFDEEYGCLILITCKDKTITFSEVGMCAYHGANCTFNGDYIMQ